MNPRLNRLKIDNERLQELAARSEFVSVVAKSGTPPDKYTLHLTCKGIRGVTSDQKPIYSESFYLEITFTDEYPRKSPIFQIKAEQTPIFHPNIAQNGLVCIGDAGDHGWAPAMRVDDVVIRIIEMIRYQNYGLLSAFNLIAAEWTKKNKSLFPLDTRPIVGAAIADPILDDIIILGGDDNDFLDDIKIW